ncbi:hypothetical protein C2R22_02425 [Salinigranum rubrum]|uniref:Uncharacterized protein n=1 Tax=Salinigranum rubrum TaxID=755307 RepID=A0A2I8VFE0_9EURY|nr:hypothetical protein [Salinigranum rubrum]AUV80650.1 hypothetical protein C2R22_02425 [Salinigranum rubrum]
MSRRFLTVLVVVLALSSALPAIVGSAQETGGDYSLDELKQRGQQIQGTDPSTRYLGSEGSVFVSYDETNFIKELGPTEPEWAVDKVVSPGEVVDTNEVTFHTTRTKGAESETVHVHVVTWEQKTRTIETENGSTTREQYAANVTETVKEVELTGAADRIEVGLPTAEDPRMVTMWIEEYPEARWVFEQHTVATASQTPFGNTWGSFLPWFLKMFFGVVVIGVPVAIGAAVKTLKKTGRGPGKGAMWYVIVGGLVMYFAGYFALGKMAEIIVTLPIVLGLIPVVLAFFAAVEYFDPSRKVRVEQLLTEKVENALGKTVHDIEYERGRTYNMVERDDGTTAILPSGSLRHWLIVLLGAKPPTIPTSELQTRVEYRGDAEDEKLYVDEMISIEWPALEISTSSLRKTVEHSPATADGVETDGGEVVEVETWDRDRISKAILFFGVGSLVATSLVGDLITGIAIGTVPLLVSLAQLDDGSATFVPSAVHTTPAKASRITETREHTVATTFGQLEEAIADLEADAAERGLDIAEAYISQSRERIDRLLSGGGDDPSPIGSQDGQKSDWKALRGDGGD